MKDWYELFQELADDPGDVEVDGGVLSFVRHGEDNLLELKELPGVGVSVMPPGSDRKAEPVPVATFVQRDLLALPRLANQVIRALEKRDADRTVPYIDGPVRLGEGSDAVRHSCAAECISSQLNETEPGNTRLIQLMATAGQGKTVLLEHLALERARTYRPDPFPVPLLLPIDLLGRYVGTIDDAIAGSLNNTYLFPGLKQKDVAICLRNRWLVLALDGFDELVARVGARDAFARITELLDQLEGQGTVLLSARESFFQLYEISNAIRSYLQPRRGSYSTLVAELAPWAPEQGEEVFQALGSSKPSDDLKSLLEAFDGDTGLVLHPFFLVRLADLWMRGERFQSASALSGEQRRIQFVIQTFIERELGEKWTDREHSAPLLDMEGHATVLGAIAEEMWRTGAFHLDRDELRIAAEIGLSRLSLAQDILDLVLEKVPTHAALSSRGRGYGFLHDRFFHYFLGHRLAALIEDSDTGALVELIRGRDFAPEVVDWTVWSLSQRGHGAEAVVPLLSQLAGGLDTVGAATVGRLTARLLGRPDEAMPMEVAGQTFMGGAMSGLEFRDVHFKGCRFWNCDLSGSRFLSCQFANSDFSMVKVNGSTSFEESFFEDVTFASLTVAGEGTYYAPGDVRLNLEAHGATVASDRLPDEEEQARPRASTEASHIVEHFIKMSQLTCDFAIEEMVEQEGKDAKDLIRLGLETGIMRPVTKSVAGPKRTFVRFQIDRDLLMEGLVGETSDAAIEAFWARVGETYPYGEDAT